MTSRPRAILMLIAVFVLGAAAGGGATWAFSARRHASMMRGDHKAFEERRVHALTHKLDLDDKQQAAVREILARDGDRRKESRSKVDAEIRAVLRPEQQQRFDALHDDKHHPR